MTDLIRQENGSYIHPDDPGEPGYDNGCKRISVTDAEAEIIATYCDGLEVVEFGTGLGVSTRAMAKVASGVVTIDVDPWVHQNIWRDLLDETFRDAPVVLTLPSVEALIAGQSMADEVVGPGPDFDLAFIDGCHTRPSVDKDIAEAMRLVKPGGLIIFHDWNHNDVRSAAADAGLTCHVEHKTTWGMGVARRP